MILEQAIIEQVRALSPEKQEEVLAFIVFLKTDEWEKTYKGRFHELQRDVQVGIDAADRGEVVDGNVLFEQLREKLPLSKYYGCIDDETFVRHENLR